MTTITDPVTTEVRPPARYSGLRLAAGVAGRAWLWFLGVCVAITLVPTLFGWHSYVIVTGSMEPGIGAGDVVLSSPDPDLEQTVGRVISFEDPAREGHVLTHRVVMINDDGTLVTRGDANPTPDSLPVPPNSVTGLGRLLVKFIGLPVVWLITGDWLPLLAHLLLLIAAVVATVFDHETGRPRQGWRTRQILDRFSSRATTIFSILALTVAAVFGSHLAADTSSAAFTGTTANTGDSWTVPNWSYTNEVNALGPYLYWKLDETRNAATAADSSGNGRSGTYSPNGDSANFTRLSNGALLTDTPDRAVQLGLNACINTASNTSISAPQVFTVIAWFRAPGSYTNGGKLIGFERPRTGVSAPTAGAYDRHLYMDGQGRIWFGVYNNAHIALNSASGLNDNQWHMAVGTQSSAGMRLFIDGVEVRSNGNTVAETQTGWWRAGCGNLSGWGAQWGGASNPGTDSAVPQNRVFAGALDELTVYSGIALTPQQVAFLYWAR